MTGDRRLGEGAFAEVYRVRHHILGRQVLKLFKHVASPAATSRMFDEARILSTLGHPNIIRVFDAGTVQTSEDVRGHITMGSRSGRSRSRYGAPSNSPGSRADWPMPRTSWKRPSAAIPGSGNGTGHG